MLFSLQFHETPAMVGLKMFQTVYKHTLCEQTVVCSPMLSSSKLTYLLSNKNR